VPAAIRRSSASSATAAPKRLLAPMNSMAPRGCRVVRWWVVADSGIVSGAADVGRQAGG
jgi:hypothetical protein